MENNLDDFFKDRPQRLCHMCGKCCRVVTAPCSYEKLVSASKEGDEGAKDFLELFEPYASIEDARKISKETVDNIMIRLEQEGLLDREKLTFYGCRFLQENNLCGIYENRKPLCDRFPSSPWAVVPPGCGFEGWLFMQRENKKQQIRKLKENLISLELMLKEPLGDIQKQEIVDAIEKINQIIEAYAKYGAKDW